MVNGLSKQGLHAPNGFVHFSFTEDGLLMEEATMLII